MCCCMHAWQCSCVNREVVFNSSVSQLFVHITARPESCSSQTELAVVDGDLLSCFIGLPASRFFDTVIAVCPHRLWAVPRGEGDGGGGGGLPSAASGNGEDYSDISQREGGGGGGGGGSRRRVFKEASKARFRLGVIVVNVCRERERERDAEGGGGGG